MKIHNHNSIPGYFDGLEDGCDICKENKKEELKTNPENLITPELQKASEGAIKSQRKLMKEYEKFTTWEKIKDAIIAEDTNHQECGYEIMCILETPDLEDKVEEILKRANS